MPALAEWRSGTRPRPPALRRSRGSLRKQCTPTRSRREAGETDAWCCSRCSFNTAKTPSCSTAKAPSCETAKAPLSARAKAPLWLRVTEEERSGNESGGSGPRRPRRAFTEGRTRAPSLRVTRRAEPGVGVLARRAGRGLEARRGMCRRRRAARSRCPPENGSAGAWKLPALLFPLICGRRLAVFSGLQLDLRDAVHVALELEARAPGSRPARAGRNVVAVRRQRRFCRRTSSRSRPPWSDPGTRQDRSAARSSTDTGPHPWHRSPDPGVVLERDLGLPVLDRDTAAGERSRRARGGVETRRAAAVAADRVGVVALFTVFKDAVGANRRSAGTGHRSNSESRRTRAGDRQTGVGASSTVAMKSAAVGAASVESGTTKLQVTNRLGPSKPVVSAYPAVSV